MSRSPAEPLVKNQVLVDERRRAIVQHAMALFLEFGFHNTTTRQICQQANIPTGTLYLYLRRKEDILYYAALHLLEAMKAEMTEEDFSSLPPREWLLQVFNRIIHVQDRYRRQVRLLVQEGHNLGRDGRQMLTQLDVEASSLFEAPLQAGIDAGVFRPSDVRFMCHQLLHFTQMWGSRPWAFRPYLTLDQYVERITGLVLHGLLL